MLRNYLTTVLRNFRKQRLYSFLNVFGMAVGLASAFLIALFIVDDLQYDDYHEHADRVYRVAREWIDENGEPTLSLARISAPIAPALEREFPEIEEAVQIWGNGGVIGYQGEHFNEPDFFFAGADLFEVLSIPLVKGDPESALAEPHTVILTEERARKYFGDADPIGRELQLDTKWDLRVTGVVGEIPHNSHFQFDFLASMETLRELLSEDSFTNWRGNNSFATYVRLVESADPEELEARFPAFLDRHYDEELGLTSRLFLQPITSIHLHSDLDTEFEANGDITYVYLFTAVAILVLLIASVNFMNLATARAFRRAREIGVRKALGAHRSQLAVQFLGEALVTSFAALFVALIIAVLLLPLFNQVSGKEIALLTEQSGLVLLVFVGVTAVVGLLSGSYPAAYLSGFGAAAVLKRDVGHRRSQLYKGLVVVQFAIAFVLVAGVGVVFKQVDYVTSRPLGFDKERLVVLSSSDAISRRFGAIRQQLEAHPGIVSATESRLIPSNSLLDQIDVRAEVSDRLKLVKGISLLPVDHKFAETYGIDLLAGRDFNLEMASDSTEAFLLNEAAVEQIGWSSLEDAVGSTVALEGTSLTRRGRIVGVLEDFHFESLHERIAPMVFLIMPERHRLVSVKLTGDDVRGTLDFLKERWAAYLPGYPFSYFEIDAAVDDLYAGERHLGKILGYFSALALLVACLGLFGLAAYAASERTKEIGIRKVLGAGVSQIVALLSRDFARLILAALLVAIPPAYLLVDRWLGSFAYRTDLGIGFFAAVAVAVLSAALVVVAYQAVTAAVTNPVESLRHE